MKTVKNYRRTMLLLAMALVCAIGLWGISVSAMMNGSPAALAEAPAPMADNSPAIYVTQRNANSVVGVLSYSQQWSSATGVTDQLMGQGSGVVIRDGGYILTNNHVVEVGTAWKILLPNGEKIDAEMVGTDSSTDMAVLRVDSDALVPVTFGATSELVVGSTVIAIGNPGGEVLANTVTQGIVSALERTSVNADNTSRRISYIQHDAAINSGNSGGGLFNYKGELVGINTLKYSGSAYSSVTFEGLGFAIPVETVQKISDALIENGRVIRPGLGISASNQNGPDDPLLSNPPLSVCVAAVNEGGAAEKAGLKQYDFITAIDGERVKSMADLTGILDLHEAGDTVTVTVVRYQQVGFYQSPSISSMFGFDFGYGYGYGNGNGNGGSSSGQLVVDGGFTELNIDVTLENLE